MKNRKIDGKKFSTKNNNLIIHKELFESKGKFHKEQAKLPFEEKIKILIRLQEIACVIKHDGKKRWYGRFHKKK